MLERLKKYAAQKLLSSAGFSLDPWSDFPYLPIPQKTASGVDVTLEKSIQLATVFACLRWLSGTISTLPVEIIRTSKDGSQENDTSHYLYEILHYQANPEMQAVDYWEIMDVMLELQGNAYSFIERNKRGRVIALWPIYSPVKVDRGTDGNIRYTIKDENGKDQHFTMFDIFHLRMIVKDGLTGLSPIAAVREVFGSAIAAQNYGSSFFGSGGRPKDILSPDKPLTKPNQDFLVEEWKKHNNSEQNRTALLPFSMNYQAITVPPNDAQFLETQQFNGKQIAAIFGVPPHKVGILDDATFDNITSMQIQATQDAILPRTIRFEKQCRMSLIEPSERDTIAVSFNINGLLRGDTETRFKAYQSAVLTGHMNRNEVRELENRNRVAGLDEYLVPTNEQNSKVIENQTGEAPVNDEPDNTEGNEPDNSDGEENNG